MALFPLLLILLQCLSTTLFLVPSVESNLSVDYYNKTCPKFHEIVTRIISERQIATPTTAAAILRLYFHDCMVRGCDASLLIASNDFNKAERDHDINASLSGDGFDVVIRAKTSLELECPGVVSCSDILSVATRDLITMVGGPFYEVNLGRKDGLVSLASEVEASVARANTSLPRLVTMFGSKGLTIQELVALSGAHTIGFSHCDQFAYRIFNFSATSQTDPAYNKRYGDGLRQLCADYIKDPTMAAFNDVITPGKFDNMYYVNLLNGLGLLESDQALLNDPKTRKFVELYAANQTAFFNDFANAMKKVSVTEVKTGKEGEIRHRCDTFNQLIVTKGLNSSKGA
ncbi:peroxidase 41-like [Impatiens glandulifera]|uniref:peroxidase 41-like n=1 Tax=Impatiens glandulifera TaxID=253017 RepID=UPI001FB11DE6|nr:peroxidase 41-like [Impatiens glandulifera]